MRHGRRGGRKPPPPPFPSVWHDDDPPSWWSFLWVLLLAVGAGFGVGELVWIFLRFLAGK